MFIEVYDRLGKPRRLEVNRVVVYDNFGNPISIVIESGPNTTIASKLGDADFHQLLENLGIKKTVICQDVKQLDLQHVQFDRR